MTPIELLRRQEQQLQKYATTTAVRRIRRFYQQARDDLEMRLRRAAKAGSDFEVQQYQALLRETRAMLKTIAGKMAGELGSSAEETVSASIRQTVRATKTLARVYGGVEPRFSLETAAVQLDLVEGVVPSLLKRYHDLGHSSWEAATIHRMQGVMALGLAEGVSTGEVADRLMDDGFMKERYRAERIARTEAMYSANVARAVSGREMAHEYPGLKKKLLAVIDDRTHPGCLALHGTVLEWDEEFVDEDPSHKVPRRARLPPLHPSCRCSIVPWHDSWGETAFTEPVEE